MNNLDMFLIQYGLAAIFVVMLLKSVGVPIPIPADLIVLTAAVRVAQGKLGLWQAFVVILVATVVGGVIQFVLARGPGRGLLKRFGRYIGLTEARLNAASEKVKKGGLVAITLAILIPGVRGAAIVASGFAKVSLRTFLAGLVLGSTLFLSVHFVLGYLGGSLLSTITGRLLPLSSAITVVIVLLVVAYALWMVAFRRQKAVRSEGGAEALGMLHEGFCPVCLALYTANRLRPSVASAEAGESMI